MSGGARIKLSLLLLVPIVVATIALAARVNLRAALSVDNRQYVEMATGVRAHGLPYTLNGYSEDFPEARPAFNLAVDGRLWGNYPPLFAYVGAAALHFGELAGIARANFIVIALLAFAVFGVGWRFTGDPLKGVAAAYLTLFATPVWASSLETLSLPLLYLWLSIAALLSLMAIEAAPRRQMALSLAAGLALGLATASHLIAFPCAAGMAAALALARRTEAKSGVERWLPERAGLLRAACVALGMSVSLVPMGLLNRVRFGTYNPISYGPCVWAECAKSTSDALNASGIVSFAAPAVPYFAVVAVALFFARKRWWAIAVVLALAALALVPRTLPGDRAFALLRTAYGYAFDTTNIVFTEWFIDAFPDGFGHVRTGHVIKSFFQSSPILLCGLFVPWARAGANARTMILGLPLLAHLVMLMLLARFKGAYAFGTPHVILRYTVVAAPFLCVLTVAALGSLRLRRFHFVLAAVLIACGLAFFLPTTSDASMVRRIVELRITLAVAVLAAVSLVLARRHAHGFVQEVASAASAVALAAAVSVSMGVDTRILATQASALDTRLQAFADLTPFRFALVGYGPVSDHVLPLRAERDINYIDLVEAPGGKWDNFRTLIDLWVDDGRPIYGVFPYDIDPPFRWPYDDWDVPAKRVDPRHEFWLIEPPPVPRRLTAEQIAGVRHRLLVDRARRLAPH